MTLRIMLNFTASILLTLVTLFAAPLPILAETAPDNGEDKGMCIATLEECLQTALENNRRRPASRYAVEMAEAQHREALAGYWPQIGLHGGYQCMDEFSNFIFPSSK